MISLCGLCVLTFAFFAVKEALTAKNAKWNAKDAELRAVYVSS
jgi:hypothetical protein